MSIRLPLLLMLIGIVAMQPEVYSQVADHAMGLPFIKTYKATDYKGESQNLAIIQNDDGIIFIANSIGFMEYDGISWRKFKPDNDGAPLSFAKDVAGIIYTGGTGFIGLFKIDTIGNTFFHSLKSTLPEEYYLDYIRKTIVFKDKVYFQNKSSVIVYDGSNSTIVSNGKEIQSMIKFDDNIYTNSEDGLSIIHDDGFLPVTWDDEIPISSINMLNRIGEDSVLVGTSKSGLFLITNGITTEVDTKLNIFFKKNLLFTSIDLPDGKIAIGTRKAGVVILNKDLSVYYRLTTAAGLAFEDVRGLFLDKGMNLWIATDNGISKIQYPIEHTYFDERLGVNSTIEEIIQFKNDLLIGTYAGTKRLKESSPSKLLTSFPYAEFEDIDGTGLSNMAFYKLEDKLLIGSASGTQSYDGNKFDKFDMREARQFYRSPSRPNLLVEAHRYGCDLLIYRQGKLERRIQVSELEDQIRGVAEDKDGSIWLGTFANGVYRLELDDRDEVRELTHYTEKDALPSMRDNLVYRVGDEVYFTTHKGIFKFNKATNLFVSDSTFGSKYANDSRFVYVFYEDEEKDVWINSFRKRETTLARRIGRNNYATEHTPFTTLRKMDAYEFYKDSEGILWIGGSDGLARYEKSNWTYEKPISYKVRIRKLTINGDSVIYYGHESENLDDIILSPNKNEVRFDNAALYFDDDNLYQYKLDGYEDEWSTWSSEPFKIYTNLGHGDYTFNVRAKNIKEVVSTIDIISFTILPPFYFTWWFLAISGLLFSIAMFNIIRYFTTRKLIKRVEELELIQKAHKQRERISRDLHDNVGSNLTYIISSLDYLTYKSSKDTKLSERANSLSDFTRDTMHQLRDTIWHISSEDVTLEKFTKRVQEMCQRLKDINEKTNCTVDVEGNMELVLSPLPALNLFRVVQESVSNAFKHAIAKNITVDINVDESQNLLIKISDDGIGFNIDESKKEGHYGLTNLKSRMEDIGAKLDISSEMDNGTVVEVKLGL
jgi:signal transduction histidine kinase